MFRLLSDKDIFERYYKSHLARRLLSARRGGGAAAAAEEAERAMLSKLKIECGHQYTSKLEGMFNDVRMAEELNEQYRIYVQENEVR